MGQDQPLFSVVIPTYRRPRQLAACLQGLSQLDYPRDRFEVIVVDDGGEVSLDDTLAPFKETLAVSLIRQPRSGPSGARNAGAATAKGEFLAFTADDCVPAADWLRTLAARFAVRPQCAFGGKIINAVPANSFSTASHLLIMYLYGYYNSLPGAARFFTPNNLAVPAGRFRAMGGFDVSFVNGTGEDREFCDLWLHSGNEMMYAPEVVVAHSHPLTFRAFCRQQFGYGRGTFRHRLLQAQRAKRRISFEPLGFYLDLLRYPITIFQEKKNRLAMLLGISQVANALGFFWESTAGRR
jgi:glycosyltransferase involved in cell wall biosynthesis